MWESPTHWPPGSGRPLRRSPPPTHRSAGSSDEDLRSASAIVTAAEPIWATFPARASNRGCRAANRNPPEAGRGSGRRRRERRGQSAALRALDFGPVRAPDSRSATRPLRTTSRSAGRDCCIDDGALAGATLEVALAARLDESASAHREAATRAVARSGKRAPFLLRLVVDVIGRRGQAATMRRAVTHQPPATTRHLPLPSRRPLDTAIPRATTRRRTGLRARPSPARRHASRCRGGAGRWAIRWAKPRRIGPYQAQRRAVTGPRRAPSGAPCRPRRGASRRRRRASGMAPSVSAAGRCRCGGGSRDDPQLFFAVAKRGGYVAGVL
jgi:hypothetical protein